MTPRIGKTGVAWRTDSDQSAGREPTNSVRPAGVRKLNWPRNCVPLTSHRTESSVVGWL